jgi:acetylornithine deacetylase/succinyl-diaminopimelate desuccinylase-like protein
MQKTQHGNDEYVVIDDCLAAIKVMAPGVHDWSDSSPA